MSYILWEELEAESGPIQMKMCPFHHTLSPLCAAWIIFQVQSWHLITAGNLFFPTFLVLTTTPSQSVPNRTSQLWSPLYHFWSPFCPVCRVLGAHHMCAFGMVAICTLFLSYRFLLQYFSFSLCFKNWLHTSLVAELNYHYFHEVLGYPKLKQHFSPLN